MAERRSIQMSTYCFYSLFLGLLYFSTCCHGNRHVSYNMLELWAAPQDASYLVSDIQSHSGRQRREAQNGTTPPKDGVLDATAANATSPPATNESTTQTSSDPFDGAEVVEDNNDYYLVKSNIQEFDSYWKDLEDAVMHETLSSSHRMAAVIDLKFTFPFYGHAVQNVTVATGGFIYMSPFLHRWLTATQYIAPLMANFDTSLRSNSNILYLSLEDSFSVEWRNVVLQDQNETGLFTFQAILKSTGQIVFVYKDVPVNVANISESQHPVKVGVSDAYYSDSYIPDLGIKRRTIYEYHKVDVKERAVKSGSVVVIDPLPTCNILGDCSSCTQHQDVHFDCHWCNKIGRCSDGLDWYRQHWDRYGCPSTFLNSSEVCGSLPPPSVAITDPINHPVPNPYEDDDCPNGKCGDGKSNVSVVLVVMIILLIAGLTAGIGGWVYYAYTHPTSKSGMWLMEHRPSQMRAKIQFWKSSSDSGAAKYKVETEA